MFSKINSGTKNNIIPDEVVLEGTLRYLYEPTEAFNPSKRLEEVVQSVCAVHRCGYDFTIETENEVVVNAPEIVGLVRETASEIVENKNDIVEHRSMAGEDFAAYAKRVPSAFIHVGTRNEKKRPIILTTVHGLISMRKRYRRGWSCLCAPPSGFLNGNGTST